ncbi:MAG: 23S rRNA (cytosine(2499)-C(5))-methyltransferase [Candidatus Omnitrophica bacterium CG11_big_fil_rev_8_21_14_0_20_63_9]|nr:MAG: 23S rRNA (cytosine(2499)-C(5))-methyltransferase [Candidatus Omnitrophica bacterium CG11_big_fil_rev_8_21_14_0_20_63_9]
MITMRITAEAERRVRFGHPWLYQEAIQRQSQEGSPGALVALYDRRNRFLAVGLYDPMSPIRVRILQRHRHAPIDEAWLVQRLQSAIARRAPLLQQRETTGVRLVHGENDHLPGAVVDQYDTTLVLKLYTAAWLAHVPMWIAALTRARPMSRLILRLSRAVQDQAAALGAPADGTCLVGRRPTAPILFSECGLRFEVDPIAGQKTGFFLDQRENRRRVGQLAAGRTVLDAFAYTGGFSVYAAHGGAREILSIDASRPALEAAQRNMARNRSAGLSMKHHVRVGDAFEVLEQLRVQHRVFDLVVLDPPSFAQRAEETARALSAYRRLTRAGLAVLRVGGLFMISSCSSRVPAEEFFALVHHSARQAGRRLNDIERTSHPLDHPIGFPEGAYLKALFARA